ncbi:hypothetical protein [Ensifer adhaerens]|uniref:hypothetical protein n=1 Tax=Ensifer adhaerens TaxID=106592 RepID=UPI001319F37B|nr:hypothetical protein [Ensifer adhaerens]
MRRQLRAQATVARHPVATKRQRRRSARSISVPTRDIIREKAMGRKPRERATAHQRPAAIGKGGARTYPGAYFRGDRSGHIEIEVDIDVRVLFGVLILVDIYVDILILIDGHVVIVVLIGVVVIPGVAVGICVGIRVTTIVGVGIGVGVIVGVCILIGVVVIVVVDINVGVLVGIGIYVLVLILIEVLIDVGVDIYVEVIVFNVGHFVHSSGCFLSASMASWMIDHDDQRSSRILRPAIDCDKASLFPASENSCQFGLTKGIVAEGFSS